MRSAVLILWLLALAAGLAGFQRWERRVAAMPGAALDPGYRGLFFSSLVYGVRPRYARAALAALALGGLSLLPMGLALARRRASFQRGRDYAGNCVGPAETRRALANFARLEKRRRWPVRMTDRNAVWVGVDLLTLEDVYLEGEQLFQGILIIGGQGTGKTSRYFKTILNQLALDPAKRTAFVMFTLKNEDSQAFQDELTGLGQASVPWAMSNLLDLAVDRAGSLEPGKLQGLLQGAALAAGLGSKQDPFWLNASIRRLVTAVYALSREGGAPTLGQAYARFIEEVAAKGADARMDQSLVETLSAALAGMTDPSSRAAALYSPCRPGGLHLGPLYAAAGAAVRQRTPAGWRERRLGDRAELLPQGLYEVPPSARLSYDWGLLLRPLSFILPPPGAGKGERFALNLVKQSLLSWIADDIAAPGSRLLRTKPADRFRIVLAQDECQNFLALAGEGMTDVKALQEHRQAGLVSIGASQALSALAKGSREQNEAFLAVNGTALYLGVAGPERRRVLEAVGKVKVRRIRRSYGRSEESGARGADAKGGLQARRLRANVTESIHEEQAEFISAEDYARLPAGAAILTVRGRRHRLVYCPYHNRVRIRAAAAGPDPKEAAP